MIDKIEQYISSRKIYNRSCYQLTLEELRDTARESREIAQVFNMVADIIEQKILPSDWRNADHADDAPGEVAS